jgi:hypothetical protein
MNTKPWSAAAGLFWLAALYIGPQPAAATEPTVRESRIPGAPAPAAAALATSRSSGSATGDCSGEPPPAAKEAGLTKLAFCDDFASAATIDLAGTLKPGFKWYITGLPFRFRGSSATAYTVDNGILTVRPEINQAQMSMLSAVVPSGQREAVGWYIDRQVNGWYAEARISHGSNALRRGFPAFWAMDMCHLYRYPAPCRFFVEPDFYEFIHGGEVRAVHRYENRSIKRPTKLDIWMNYHPKGSKGIDPGVFKKVGLRALPDSVNHYVNDQQLTGGSAETKTVKGTFSWVGDVVAGPRKEGAVVGRYPIIFGSGPEMPFQVDWVRVWTKP